MQEWNASMTSPHVCQNDESWGVLVTSLASSLILVGNLLVIIVVIRYPSHHFRPLHWFLFLLAFADFIVGLTILWIGTISPSFLSTVTLMTGIATYGTLAAATSISTLGVLFIAIDRYLYVLQQNNYKKIVTKKKVGGAITLAGWVPLIVFVMGPALGWNCIDQCDCQLYNLDPSLEYCFGMSCSQMMTPFRKETVLIGGLALLFILIAATAIYIRLFIKVRSRSIKSASTIRRNSELNMIKTMVMVLGGFVLTTGPLAVCCIASFFYNERSMHFVMRTLVVVSTLNSILNPFFYFWRIPGMRSILLAMFCCSRPRYHDDRFSVRVALSRRMSRFSFKSSGRLQSTSGRLQSTSGRLQSTSSLSTAR